LRDWEREDDWAPDVLIIDYADILDMSMPGVHDQRDRINAVWKQLRRLSQEKHCLVVTATQSNRAGYSTYTIDMDKISEEKRKLSHVTGIVGLNQTEAEEKQGLMRLNWVIAREGRHSSKACVACAMCLALANPAVKTCWARPPSNKDDDEET